MFASSFHIRLPRRVTAYFLLFGLTAVVWLSAGAFYVARSVNQSRSESACLRWLGRGATRISLDYLQHSDANLQALVHEIDGQSGADYCAIASTTGRFLANTSDELIGQPAAEHNSADEQWGDATRARFVGAQGQ